MAQTGRMQGRVVVVTGGASGIGEAAVRAFLDEGARVVIADVASAAGEAAVAQFGGLGYGERVQFRRCDVSQERDVEQLVEFAVSRFGGLDSMVNNAGTGGAFGPLIETNVRDWDRTQEILLRGVFLGIKHAARAMIRQGRGGSIVNVGSIAAHAVGCGGAAYAAAKAGVVNLTRSASVQLAPHRIRCNSASPGMIVTPLLLRGGDEAAMMAAAAKTQPWPAAGLAEDIAPVILFLASDDAKFITGEDVTIDGGLRAGSPNIFGGDHPLGMLMTERMTASGVRGFDPGSHNASLANAERPHASTVESANGTPKLAVITGVARGLGRALAEKLIELGHTVVGCARSDEAMGHLRATYPAPHRFDVVDVTREDEVGRWSEQVCNELQAPDFLINNAALVNRPTQAWRLTAAEFAEVMNVNLHGTVNVVRAFAPHMMRRRQGVIVNYSSGWGRETAPKVSAYCASKWAVEGFTRSLASELPVRMAAVTLHPGIVQTDTLRQTFGEDAQQYPTPTEWAEAAAPFILGIGPEDNGRPLSVPGMTDFKGPAVRRMGSE